MRNSLRSCSLASLAWRHNTQSASSSSSQCALHRQKCRNSGVTWLLRQVFFLVNFLAVLFSSINGSVQESSFFDSTRLSRLSSAFWLVGAVGQSATSLPYTSGTPPPAASPILAGVCNFRNGNPCAPEAICHPSVPIVGEAICQCPRGYGGDGKRAPEGQGCQNIDECGNGTHTCNSRTQDCMDLPGSYRCACKKGYTLAPDGKTCVDIDECSRPNLNICDSVTAVCHNLEGTYECRCVEGTMVVDEVTGSCRDLNECEDKGGIMNPCDQICTNLDPGVKCSCKDGWVLGEDGHSCIDVNECQVGTHTCGKYGDGGATCENTEGSYKCVCSAEKGWINHPTDPRRCDNLNECKTHPYICGGADSCCGDLMPPQKFACMMPISSGDLPATNTMGGTLPAAAPRSSVVGGPLGGFTSGGDAILASSPPVGPAAAAVMAAAAAAAAAQERQQSLPAQQAPPVRTTGLPTTSYRLPDANSAPHQPTFSSSSARVNSPHSSGSPPNNDCLEIDVVYIGWDISGTAAAADSALACQQKCQSDPGCDFFSYSISAQNCFLKASNFGRSQLQGFLSGPKFCRTTQSSQAFSGPPMNPPVATSGGSMRQNGVYSTHQPGSSPGQGAFNLPTHAANSNAVASVGPSVVAGATAMVGNLLGRRISGNVISGQGHAVQQTPAAIAGASTVLDSVLRRHIEPNQVAWTQHSELLQGQEAEAEADGNLQRVIEESILEADIAEKFGPVIGAEYVVVIAGDLPIEQLHKQLQEKARKKLESGEASSGVITSEVFESSLAENLAGSLLALPARRLLKRDSSSDDGLNAIDATSSPSTSGDHNLRRLQRLSILRQAGSGAANVANGLLGGRLPSSIVPRIGSGGGYQCPNGFDLGQNLYRSRVRSQTIKTLQTALVGSVNPDGTTTPGLTPETFTDGIVRNSNLLANRMATWYNELSAVPAEMVAASQHVATAVDPTNALIGTADAFGVSPGQVAAGAALGTGMVVAGIDKAVYGGGPGDSYILDRTGTSKQMAYGLI